MTFTPKVEPKFNFRDTHYNYLFLLLLVILSFLNKEKEVVKICNLIVIILSVQPLFPPSLEDISKLFKYVFMILSK